MTQIQTARNDRAVLLCCSDLYIHADISVLFRIIDK